MIEQLGTQALAKLSEQAIVKAGELKLQNEITRQMAQQETFRIGEMTAVEISDFKSIKERESLAADEIRNSLESEFNVRQETLSNTDGVSDIFGERLSPSTEPGVHNLDATAADETNRLKIEENSIFKDIARVEEKPQIVQNKEDGCRREEQVIDELRQKYPEDEGFRVLRERDIVDVNGLPVTDPFPPEGKKPSGRRIDIAVVDKVDNVKDLVEVTSPTAPKEEQMAKEQRIREAEGNYIRDPETGKLYDISQIQTRIERRI